MQRLMILAVILHWMATLLAGIASAAEFPPREQFHLYLLIGQSNMAGRGRLEVPAPATSPRVLKLGQDLIWTPAVEPLHFDNPSIAGAGLGFTFAESMAEANPSVTIGLIPCAVGGTLLSRWEKGGDLYRQAVQRTKKGQEQGTLKGILWHQGEQDALDLDMTNSYAVRLQGMVNDLRIDLNSPVIPFVAGELGEFMSETYLGKPNHWKLINQQLHQAEETIPHFGVVSALGLTPAGDLVHFETPALRDFGRRYAATMQTLQK